MCTALYQHIHGTYVYIGKNSPIHIPGGHLQISTYVEMCYNVLIAVTWKTAFNFVLYKTRKEVTE